MSTYFPISLALDVAKEKELLQLHEILGKLLEKALPIAHPQHEAIKQQLSSILHAQPAWVVCIADPYTQRVLALQHPDTRILNLPWEMALEGQGRLYLSKNTFAPGAAYAPENPLPLKILVMVSSPEDSSVRSRLSFEEEELAILRACGNLFETGQVQIDFTEDGSLHNLRQKLKDNHYHILHFSGHGVFHEGQGSLELEDEDTQQRQLCKAQDFAAALSATPEHLPALVLLSSCKTAQAGQDSNFSGVAQELLIAKVPAVVAMGWSILDHYANCFAELFYQALAERVALPQAFQKAIQHIRQLQDQELAQAQITGLASQWFIPQLYLAGPLDKIANLEKGEKKLRSTALNFTMKDHPSGYYFVGRRRDKRTLLSALFAQQPIWLQGQGGLGKSSLAEHLVQRLLAKDIAIQPFVLDENSMDLLALRAMLYAYFNENNRLTIEIEAQRFSEKAPEQVLWLLTELRKVCTPIFVFDNLESFQIEEGNPEFAEQHSELQEILQKLTRNRLGYLIFTGRYPAPAALATSVLQYSLKMVSFGDFWKKTQQLRLVSLRQSLLLQQKNAPSNIPQLTNYEDLIQWLYHTFGGNYRALEFFDEYFSQNPDKISQLLADLDKFPQLYIQETQDTLQRMSANLVFERLLALLNPLEQQTLSYLRRFRRPVLPLALSMQDATPDYLPALQRLLDLTLIEAHVMAEEENLLAYYAPPLVKNLLEKARLEWLTFSQLKAGAYFEYVDKELKPKGYNYLEEAYEHYGQVVDEEGLNRCGKRLSDGYYGANLFAKSLHFSMRTFEQLGNQTDWSIVNRAGLVFDLYANYKMALELYECCLQMVQQIGDRSGEGTTLNNIGQIYDAKGDYNLALDYLEQSLVIQQEIGNPKEEGITLNNIGQIYKSKGDYDTALQYLERSLGIYRQIGNWKGESSVLNNLSQIHKTRGDFYLALDCLEQSLAIQQRIGNRSGVITVLNNIAGIHRSRGDYDLALDYLQQSLVMAHQIGLKSGEGTILNNISQIHKAKGNYDSALQYLEQSLAIRQQIGDCAGESTTLNNIAGIYIVKKDYDLALDYLKQSFTIQQQIGNRSGEGNILNNLSQVYSAKGDYDIALDYLEQSRTIQQQIGDRSGLCATLHNMATLYLNQKDDPKKYLELEILAYQTAQEIGDVNAIYEVGKSLGSVLCEHGATEQGLPILQNVYQLGLHAGYPDVENVGEYIRRHSG